MDISLHFSRLDKIKFMNTKTLCEKFNQTIDTWIGELARYDYHQLCLQPSPDSWSMGQLYQHLIEETAFYFRQVEICQSNDENEFESMTDNAKDWLQKNSFPDKKLAGPPGLQSPANPGSKKQLLEDMNGLKALINEKGEKLSENVYKGKTKHPGFNYLNAAEWYQYAAMHFRHHLRQKERLDEFLRINSN
jgi:hypothetical protein